MRRSGKGTVSLSVVSCIHDLNLAHAVNSVRWFRARADMQRWDEEEQLLREEFKRCYRTFRFLMYVWTKTTHTSLADKAGFLAYAHERADMYNSMAEDCVTGEVFDRTDLWYAFFVFLRFPFSCKPSFLRNFSFRT